MANQNGKQKITIVANNVTIDNVFRQIERQTGLRFMYALGDLNVNEKVNVNFNDTFLEEVLKSLLSNRGFIWQYRDGIIALKQQNAEKAKTESAKPSSYDFPDITGRIMDGKGGPIPGATIQIKGTKRGTKTDADGRFTISDIEPGSVLLVTSIGYENREIIVGNEKQIVINLAASTGYLDETVVVAYGTSKTRNIVGNVAVIKAEEIERSPVSNPLLAIQGRVPGIYINQNMGLPGAGISTMIQGQNSINKGNDPFYVIDGVPYTSQLLPNFGTILGNSGVNLANSGNPLSYINPSDIESITILKDADATAIYGSRAANGAILITTKKGKVGSMDVNINYQQGWQKVTRTLDLLSREEYLEMRHEAKANDGLGPTATDYDLNGFWDSTRNTNWQKELLGKTAQYTNLTASVSGGTTNVQYLFGSTYHRETIVFPGNFADQKGSVHFNLNTTSQNQKFRAQFSGSYLVDDNQLPNVDLTSVAITLSPVAPALYNSDGTLNWQLRSTGTSSWTNPLSYLNNKYSNRANNLVSNAVLGYTILPGLDLRSNFGYTNLQTNEVLTFTSLSQSPANRPNYQRSGNYGNGKIESWIIEPQLTYNFKIGKHNFDFLLGTSIQQSHNSGTQYLGIGFTSDEFITDIHSATQAIVLSNFESHYKYNALFGRINYNLANKYIFNFSARRDGSSRFGVNNRFHNFGSIGAGWIFSEENLVHDALPFLSFGKIRASYGITGNDQIGDYQFLNLYQPVSVGVAYRNTVGLVPLGIPNPYLQWEATKKFSAGIDIGILKSRILLNVTHNINRSSNLLKSQALPWAAGINNITVNFPGTLQNTGWEFTFNSKNVVMRDFNWSTSLNLTIPRNKLVAYPGLESSSDAGYFFIGSAITTVTAFHSTGVNPETGLYQFSDSKGNNTSNPQAASDRTARINIDPRFYGGIQNTFSYKQFELNILFQFVKRTGYNYSLGANPGAGRINQPKAVLDRWRKQGDIASHQRFTSNSSLLGYFNKAISSDAVYSDASFIRLKNVALSWQLPERIRERVRLKGARIFAEGQNLITITNFVGLDPETGATTLPPLRTFVLGAQISL